MSIADLKDRMISSAQDEERYRGKAVPKEQECHTPSTVRNRVLDNISNEKKQLFSLVGDCAVRMEGDAINTLMQDLIILNRLEDEARGLSNT